MLKKSALSIGISNYANGVTFEHCSNDAEALSECLKMTGYDFETVVHSGNITSTELRTALEEFFSVAADFYLFYYSGHGYKSRFDTHFVTSELTDFGAGLSLNYLNNAISGVANPDAPIVVFLDCCHAGSYSLIPENCYISQTDIKNSISTLGFGRVLIASCLSDQVSQSFSIHKSSIFSYHLLEGLSGNAVDIYGEVTISELYSYIDSSFRNNAYQSPLMQGHVSGLVLGSGFNPKARVNPEPIDLQMLREEEIRAKSYNSDLEHLVDQSDPDRWSKQGFRTAQNVLPDILSWFDTKSSSQSLASSTIFRGGYARAQDARRRMTSLYEGVDTLKGKIVGVIGGGGFGKVWKVEDSEGKQWAYKVCHPHVLDDSKMVGWFRRGFRAMKRLDHPNVVRVEEGFFTEAPIGFFMEYIDGPNWFDYSPKRNMSMSQRLEHLSIVGDVVHYAHAQDTVHRDIKPQNIIIKYDLESGEILTSMLTDFDLAYYTRDSLMESDTVKSLVFTYSYASPEFRRNPEQKSARQITTDIYSFGQLLFFVSTGYDPDPSASEENLKLLKKELFEENVSARTADALTKLYEECTRFSASNRIDSMKEVCERVRKIASLLDREDTLTEEDFLDQIMYQLLGVDRREKIQYPNATWDTTGNRFQITLLLTTKSGNNIDLNMTCLAQQELAVGGGTFRSSKEQLHVALIRTAKSNIFGCNVRRSDYTTTFKSEIDFIDVPRTEKGIDEVVEVIRDIINTLHQH